MPKSKGIPGAIIISGQSNEDINQAWNGVRGLKTIKEMMYDSTISSILYAAKSLAKTANLRVDPFEDDNESDKEQSELIWNMFHDMDGTLSDFMSQAITMLEYGWSISEIVLKVRQGWTKNKGSRSKYNDGLIGISRLAPRHQGTLYRWDIDEETLEIKNIIQRHPVFGKEYKIPMDKMLLFRTVNENDNPQGKSVLRASWKSWRDLNRLKKSELNGIERDLNGSPLIRMPREHMFEDDGKGGEKATAEYLRMQDICSKLRAGPDVGLVIPSDHEGGDENESSHPMYSVELLTGGSRNIQHVRTAIRDYQNDILSTVLADFIKMGQGEVGSFALSKEKTSLFAVSVKQYLDIIVSTINNDLIPKIYVANGWDTSRMCQMQSDFDETNLSELSDIVGNLFDVGALDINDEKTREYISRAFGVPVTDPAIRKESEEAEAEEEAAEDDEDEAIAEESDDSEEEEVEKVKGLNNDLQELTGIIMKPDFEDGHDEQINCEEIMKAMNHHDSCGRPLKLQHEVEMTPEHAYVMDSFIAPIDMEVEGLLVPKGSWAMRVKILNKPLWNAIKSGVFKSFSPGGKVKIVTTIG